MVLIWPIGSKKLTKKWKPNVLIIKVLKIIYAWRISTRPNLLQSELQLQFMLW